MEHLNTSFVTFKQIKEHLIVIQFHDVVPTFPEFDNYLHAMEELYDAMNGIVFIFDGTKSKYLSSDLRIRQGEWLLEHEDLIKQKCAGHVYVTPSALTKLMLKGIFLVKKTPVAYKIVDSMREAYSEADVMLRTKGWS